MTLGVFLLFLSEYGVFSSKCSFILTLFYGEKLKDVLRLDYCFLFGRKVIILCHVQLYSPPFRRRKDCKSRSRLKRRRESVTTGGFCHKHNYFRLYYLYKRDRIATTVRPCNLRQNRRATSAQIWGSVRSQIRFDTSVIFYIVMQSTGLTFPPSSLTRDDFAEL